MRATLILVFLLSLLGQSVTQAGQGLLAIGSDGIEHATLHWDKHAHHHHEDGTIHEEDSDGSLRHLQADGILVEAGLPPCTPITLPCTVPPAAAAAESSTVPSLVLDGLRRPPRLPA